MGELMRGSGAERPDNVDYECNHIRVTSVYGRIYRHGQSEASRQGVGGWDGRLIRTRGF